MPAPRKALGPLPNEQELMQTIYSFKYEPSAGIYYMFPWGEDHTPLAQSDGPRAWQLDDFHRIEDHLVDDLEKQRIGLPPSPLYLARSSGRGPGKSAWLGMINYWAASCWPGMTGIVTANTETQLRSRTMAELGKWHTMAINRHWFEKSTMALRPAQWYAGVLSDQLSMDTQYYYVEGQSWSEENPDAFAGAHSNIGMVVSFDEASGISDKIWNVTEGFFTDATMLRLWMVISNGRRNSGRFFDCFHTNSKFWDTKHIDSRTVEGLDAGVYQRIADQYGEDHDVTRVEVRGLFPRTGSNQFIGRETAVDATIREVEEERFEPLLMGVDVARFGDDESVVRFRQGRDARTIKPVKFKGIDTMRYASEIGALIDRYKPDGVFVDGGGVGGGVVDRLKQLGYRVIEVQFGERARDPEKYLNRRVECWAAMRDWMLTGAIDGDDLLVNDLAGPEYEITGRGQIKLETKDSMKKRGLRSPDDGDALALTFAEPVARVDHTRGGFRTDVAIMEYDEFA